MIGYQGVQKILHPEDLQVPGVLALAAAVLSSPRSYMLRRPRLGLLFRFVLLPH